LTIFDGDEIDDTLRKYNDKVVITCFTNYKMEIDK